MDQLQANRLKMARTTQTFLNDNAATWSAVPIITNTKTEIDGIVDLISAEAERQAAASISVTATKAAKKRAVAEKIDILNDAVEAYGAITGNAALENEAAKSFSDLYRQGEEDFRAAAVNQIAMVEEHIDDLADYGVTQALVDDVKADLNGFLELSGKPRTYIITRRQATEGLESLFDQLREGHERLDKVMKIFKRSQPDFYNGYVAAREIVGD